MKKVSTVAAKQSSDFSNQRLTIGLDLGDRSSHYCVLEEAGRILLESKVSTSPNAMRTVFGAMARSRIALETGTHSPWVSRLLSKLGHEVIVAHARNVRLIGESRRKDDRLDAQTLARLARIDPELLCPVKHRSVKAQADLTVIRARAGLVRARTALVNAARGLAKSYGERPASLDHHGKATAGVECREDAKIIDEDANGVQVHDAEMEAQCDLVDVWSTRRRAKSAPSATLVVRLIK